MCIISFSPDPSHHNVQPQKCSGIAGAFVSHPADLILTLTSASSRGEGQTKDWRMIVQDLLDADGGPLNLYAGFSARAVFFFLVIGLQFFLCKNMPTYGSGSHA